MIKLRGCGATCAPLLLFMDPGCPWSAVNSTSSPSVSEVALIANISHGLRTRHHPATLPPTICPNRYSGGAWLRRARGASHCHEVTITVWQMFYIPVAEGASKLHHKVFWHCAFNQINLSLWYICQMHPGYAKAADELVTTKITKSYSHFSKKSIFSNIDWTAAVADLTTLMFGDVWNSAGGVEPRSLFFFFYLQCSAFVVTN